MPASRPGDHAVGEHKWLHSEGATSALLDSTSADPVDEGVAGDDQQRRERTSALDELRWPAVTMALPTEEDTMQSLLLDVAGRSAPFAGDHARLPPREGSRNKGLRYPADPPRAEEIVAVKQPRGRMAEGLRLRAPLVVLWRAGLRIGEALALAETALDPVRRTP